MVKTKTTSRQLPRGLLNSQKQLQQENHLDTVNSLLAEEHYGKYLVVKNGNGVNMFHDRQYICYQSMVEFLTVNGLNNGMLNAAKKRGMTDIHLISRFPRHSKFIRETIFSLIESYEQRTRVGKILRGFGHFLSVLVDINWKTIDEINSKHLKEIEKDAKSNSYSKSKLASCTTFLNKVKTCTGKEFQVPNYKKYGFENSKKNELSLAISWQCDLYACKELDETMKLVNEYKEWMSELKDIQAQYSEEELKQHGGLFSIENLIFTYFDNLDNYGSAANGPNMVIRRAAKALYSVELKVWRNSRGHTKEERKKEFNLRENSEHGINITIRDERMFAIWHKVIVPNYPLSSDFLPEYSFIQDNLQQWRNTFSRKCGFSLQSFDRRIYPNVQTIYPLYLLSLCRSGLNQQPIKDWRTWKDENGKYNIGEDSGMGRIVDGFKGRGNTIQSTALDRQQCKYVDFFCDYAALLFEHSNDDHFFQYAETKSSKKGTARIWKLDSPQIKSMFVGKTHFFYRNKIVDMVSRQDGSSKEKRIYSIKHENIRKIKNLSEYLSGKIQWERQFERGHKDIKTEVAYQQTSEFQGSKQHRIGNTMNILVDFFKGKVLQEQNPKLQIFNGPLANCKDPLNPTYNGAQKLKNDDTCSNWRKCLTLCDKCEPVKSVHGANIMSWLMVMEELRSIYATEEWERLFLLDYMSAEATLKAFEFTDEERVDCETKAKQHGRLTFIRKEVLNSQRFRKINIEEQHYV